MNNSLQNRSLSKDEMRAAYCNALIDLAKVNDKIVVVDCDLAHSMGTLHFAETFAKCKNNWRRCWSNCRHKWGDAYGI